VRIVGLVAVAAVTILTFAACGNSGAAPGATATPIKPPAGATAAPTAATVPTSGPVGATIDVCKLLTGAEVKAATGKNYGEGYADADFPDNCSWNTDGATVNRGDLIGVSISSQDLAYLKATFGQGGVDATVNGHAAFWNPSQGLGSMWVDIGGGRLLVLSFPRSSDLDPSYTAIAQKLAEIAVARIPG
jgi:hypothetical protein